MKKLASLADIAPDTEFLSGIDMTGNLQRLFHTPTQVPASLFLLCTRGNCSVSIHLNSYELRPNTLAVVFPEQFLQITGQSNDCRFLFVAFSPLLTRGSTLFSKLLEFAPYLYEQPILHLSDPLADFFARLYMLCIKSARLTEPIMLKSLYQTYYFQFTMCMANLQMQNSQEAHTPYNRNEEIVRELARHIIENYKKERNISFYADKMHLSPQHLSTTIKKATGRTLTDIISNLVINDAKGKLRSTELTIQEIAYSLNFPDISFFGKYFKRYTGLSPKQYRKQK